MRTAVACLAIAGVVGGCTGALDALSAGIWDGSASRADPTTPPPGSLGERLLTIEREVEAIRGLPVHHFVYPTVMTEAELRAQIAEDQASGPQPAWLTRREDRLASLGAITPETSMSDALATVDENSLIGYYQAWDGKLVVVTRDGDFQPWDEVTFAHEYTHALQDQNFDLLDEEYPSALKPQDSDRELAEQALIEGDAERSSGMWARAYLPAAALDAATGGTMDAEERAALEAVPVFVRNTTWFPYVEGTSFVTFLQQRGGWAAVDDAFRLPPATTEQVLHPSKYLAHELAPVLDIGDQVLAALGGGWERDGPPDRLGELQLRSWLQSAGIPGWWAARAAAGWNGDQLQLFRGPNDAVLMILATRWDTAADARDFATLARVAVVTHDHSAVMVNGSTVTTLIASDDGTLAAAKTSLGGGY